MFALFIDDSFPCCDVLLLGYLGRDLIWFSRGASGSEVVSRVVMKAGALP